MPTPGSLFGAIVFGSVGLAAFVYGKKSGLIKPTLIGIALMVYPYFIEQAWMVFAVGFALCFSLYVFRE